METVNSGSYIATVIRNHDDAWTCSTIDLDIVRINASNAIIVSSSFDFYHSQFLPSSASSAILLLFMEKKMSTPTAIHHLQVIIAKRLKIF